MIVSFAGFKRQTQTEIGDAIKSELMKHPDTITSVTKAAGVGRGGRFNQWLNGRSDMLLTTAEKLAAELGYEIVLRKAEQ